MLKINPERLLSDLKHLRTFGATGPGVVRLSLSPVDMAARRWLAGRMNDAGLSASIDGVGTVFGRSRNAGPALLIGSHTDTQPTGGWLDGALGVIYGLEIARALAECEETRHFAVDIASWIDEEGTFSGFLGSRSFVGENVDEAVRSARNREGVPLANALKQAGLAEAARVRIDKTRHKAYLEPHIEQGGRLEANGKSIGVVTTIVGIRELKLHFTGQRNHAGTTPMSIRRDAGAALVAFIARVDEAFRQLADADTVWTVGRIELDPGSFSVVPGAADLYLQFRDASALARDGSRARRADPRLQRRRPCERRHDGQRAARRARDDGRRVADASRERGRSARVRSVGTHAERRVTRCAGHRASHARVHAIRAEHRRRQSRFHRRYGRGAYRAGLRSGGEGGG